MIYCISHVLCAWRAYAFFSYVIVQFQTLFSGFPHITRPLHDNSNFTITMLAMLGRLSYIILTFRLIVGYDMGEVEEMSLITTMLEKERSRNEYMREYYSNQIAALPKGSVVAKKAGNNIYYYLQYRNGPKVLSDYIGKESEKVDRVREQTTKRKHFEAMLSKLNKEHAEIQKTLEVIK